MVMRMAMAMVMVMVMVMMIVMTEEVLEDPHVMRFCLV